MHEHDNIMLTEAVERYISGEMSPDERLHFENLRKADAEIDQMVVTHTLFMQRMNRYNEWQKFQASLNEIHTNLATQGKIDSPALKGKAKLVYLYNRYKRVASIAASIAGLTALLVSAILWSVTPKTQSAKLDLLNRSINTLKTTSRQQAEQINLLKNNQTTEVKTPEITYSSGGTGFIIDSKGLLVTNAHVIQNAQNIAVASSTGTEYFAKVVYLDPVRDIALLKITDKDFKPLPPVPYGFTRKMADLAEPVFTLGYPREDIVYNQGYLSAKTGFNGDTLSCQIEIAANRGNSGSPILNNEGDVIGILNGRQKDQEGVAFFIRSRNLYNVLNEVRGKEKTDSSIQNIKLNTRSSIANLNRTQQAKKIQDYVFMVKVN
ncbi:S1C family serine protease [Niabella beijingensis]|uniref:S1C family serine protease n=1 Tax=Niabella beijingensis TaxID=2872700 RepID=UPI001CBDB035|nr:serine protease [Niabella beijingensis]MBZ4187391.1 serine protease [Niabella beijingensis]